MAGAEFALTTVAGASFVSTVNAIAAGEVGIAAPTVAGATIVVEGKIIAKAEWHHAIMERFGKSALGKALNEARLFNVNELSNKILAWQNGKSMGHRAVSASVENAWNSLERAWKDGELTLSEAAQKVIELQAKQISGLRSNSWKLASTKSNPTAPSQLGTAPNTGSTMNRTDPGGSSIGGLLGKLFGW